MSETKAQKLFNKFEEQVAAAEAHYAARTQEYEAELTALKEKRHAAEGALGAGRQAFDTAVASGDDEGAVALHGGLAVLESRFAALDRAVKSLEGAREKRLQGALDESARMIEDAVHGAGADSVVAALARARELKAEYEAALLEMSGIQHRAGRVSWSWIRKASRGGARPAEVHGLPKIVPGEFVVEAPNQPEPWRAHV